jgi:hypothetical protein
VPTRRARPLLLQPFFLLLISSNGRNLSYRHRSGHSPTGTAPTDADRPLRLGRPATRSFVAMGDGAPSVARKSRSPSMHSPMRSACREHLLSVPRPAWTLPPWPWPAGRPSVRRGVLPAADETVRPGGYGVAGQPLVYTEKVSDKI